MPHTTEILTSTEQIGRRCIGQYEIPPFRDNVHTATGDFMQFCEALEVALPFDMPSELDRPEMALRLHGAGAGYIGRITHIALTATELAIDRGVSRLTQALLGEAYKNISKITDDVNPFFVEDFNPEQFAIIRAKLETKNAQDAVEARRRGRRIPEPDFTK